MSGFLVRNGFFFLAVLGWDHDEAAVAHAALGNDVVGEMLHLGSGPFQRRHFHAVVVVEVDMKRRHREIMMAMIVLHQASRRVAGSISQCSTLKHQGLPQTYAYESLIKTDTLYNRSYPVQMTLSAVCQTGTVDYMLLSHDYKFGFSELLM